MPAQPAVPAPQMDLPGLEALPWLVHAEPAPSAAPCGRSTARRGRGKLLISAGIAVAFATLCGGASYLASGLVEEPAPLVQPASLPQARTAPATSAAVEADAAATPTSSTAPAEARQTPIIAQDQTARETQAARIRPSAPTRKPSLAPRSHPSPANTQALASETASTTATPPPPVADSPASAATLQAYRAAMEESRAVAREVIRLGSRQRPRRDASVEEHTAYRLRQQNAAAARDYRKYLDTLARSMRGTPSETLARQSLEKARQTLSYLEGMLADSQASLR